MFFNLPQENEERHDDSESEFFICGRFECHKYVVKTREPRLVYSRMLTEEEAQGVNCLWCHNEAKFLYLELTHDRQVTIRRRLRVADIVTSFPCRVVITHVKGEAIGHCFTCKSTHYLDLPRYNRGEGPWKLDHHLTEGDVLVNNRECRAIIDGIEYTDDMHVRYFFAQCSCDHRHRITAAALGFWYKED